MRNSTLTDGETSCSTVDEDGKHDEEGGAHDHLDGQRLAPARTAHTMDDTGPLPLLTS